MKIFIASDHAGVELKADLVTALQGSNFLPGLQREVHDLGPQSTDSVDYPDYADLVTKKVHGFSIIQNQDTPLSMPTEIGILICGSGQGMCMRANKHPAIRAALCWNPESARLAREHNDANVLCLGARMVSKDICLQIVQIFLTTPFLGGRHATRVAKVMARV
jgi:ribose 5-phosphate isomerase B